jgi:hypothetical protein
MYNLAPKTVQQPLGGTRAEQVQVGLTCARPFLSRAMLVLGSRLSRVMLHNGLLEVPGQPFAALEPHTTAL